MCWCREIHGSQCEQFFYPQSRQQLQGLSTGHDNSPANIIDVSVSDMWVSVPLSYSIYSLICYSTGHSAETNAQGWFISVSFPVKFTVAVH